MPLYEYQCRDCGVRFEVQQRFGDDPVQTCPECGGPVRRLIHPVGVIFKGSGFYVTDNRAKSSTARPGNKKTESGAEGGASAGSANKESGDGGKSDAKSE